MSVQGRDGVIVTIEDAETSPEREDVVIYIKGLLKEWSDSTQSKPTIFEVDDRLRKVNPKDYEPKIVSIGPIHHGSHRVKKMERQKARFLQELLREREDLSVEKLVGRLREMEDDARRCYSRSSILDKDKFLGILVVDGCFIIQLIRNYFFGKNKDPIFESETLIQITHDLMLFENQLPFFVLSALFDMTKTGSNPDNNLSHLILFLVGDIVPWLDYSKAQFLPDRPDHLLALVYRCISTKIPPKHGSDSDVQLRPERLFGLVIQTLPIPFKPNGRKGRKHSSSRVKKTPAIHINSASELKEVGGIRLKMSEDNHLSFTDKVLKFPALQVSGETESLLRNLMAYEQLQLDDDQPRHVIDYVFFVHCLARSIKDVEILRYSGIIKNYLGGDHKILQMLDRLGTNFMRSSEFSYSSVFESLNRHCSNRRNEWMASLGRTYFNGPWSVIKFLAATSLLLLAAAQTLFTILSYTKQTSSPSPNN